MKLREGNVFTPVCDSIHRSDLCPGRVSAKGSLSRAGGGSLSGGGLCGSLLGRPPHSKEQAVHILLECILVHLNV